MREKTIQYISVSTSPFFAKPPLKTENYPNPPLLGNSPYILVYHELPPKIQISQPSYS